jgi:hypothetical protein
VSGGLSLRHCRRPVGLRHSGQVRTSKKLNWFLKREIIGKKSL